MSKAGVVECIDAYVDGMRQASRSALVRSFHPDAKVVGPDDGVLKVMTREEFIAFVERNGPDPDLPAKVLAVEVSGDIATARVEDVYIGRRFIDHLALVKIDGRWQIYTKLWHVAERVD